MEICVPAYQGVPCIQPPTESWLSPFHHDNLTAPERSVDRFTLGLHNDPAGATFHWAIPVSVAGLYPVIPPERDNQKERAAAVGFRLIPGRKRLRWAGR